MNRLFLKAVLLPLALGPVLMRADVVFSNVTGTGSVTNASIVCGSGASSCPVFPGEDFSVAEEFTPAGNYSMTDAQVLVERNQAGFGQTFDVFLYSNNGGVPGSAIEQIGFGLTAASNYPGSLVTANTISTPITLVSGTPYWLLLAPHQADTFIGWMNGGSPAVPAALSYDYGATWVTTTYTGQLQIDGAAVAAAVPEPSSVGLLAGVVTLLYGIRRRHARA